MNFASGFLLALIQLLLTLLSLYTWVIIIRALISWVSPDPRNPIVQHHLDRVRTQGVAFLDDHLHGSGLWFLCIFCHPPEYPTSVCRLRPPQADFVYRFAVAARLFSNRFTNPDTSFVTANVYRNP